jgi:hypothetical protein
MAVEGFLQTRTFTAGADMSAKQYHFVKLNGSVGPTGQPVVIACSAATDKPCGVLQNDPVVVGEAAVVAVGGWTKVSSDAALTVDTFVGTSADGQADAKTPGTDTTEYIMGKVVRASGAAAGIATIELVPIPYLAK